MSIRPVTLGQVAQVRKMAVEKGLHRDVFQARLDDGTVAKFLDSLSHVCDLTRWSDNYYKLFNQRPYRSQVRIPKKPEGVGPMRLIIVAHELLEWTKNSPLEGTQEALKKHFRGWEYADDLDAAISTNDRNPKNGSYAVWVKDVREADEENASKSANDLKAEGHTGITVLERQLLEVDYFFEKGEHLDQQKVTLCSGSRDRDGRVPRTGWCGEFYVGWCRATDRFGYLRSRRVWA